MKMSYEWRPGTRTKHTVSAEVAGEVLAEMANRGRLTAKALVEESRPENAPLHGEFEWDDQVAAEKYREVQGGNLIRSLVIRREDKPTETVRAFVNVTQSFANPSYTPINIVMEQKDGRARLIQQAYLELKAFQMKYQSLIDLASVTPILEDLRHLA